jgi:hypothetical protein
MPDSNLVTKYFKIGFLISKKILVSLKYSSINKIFIECFVFLFLEFINNS